MSYQIDSKNVSLDEFKGWLSRISYFLPSRKTLADDIDNRVACLKDHGINSLHELINKLKTKKQVIEFAGISKLPEDYLTSLRREAASYQAPPRKLADFPRLEPKIVKALEAMGIKNTKQLYDRIASKKERDKLQKEINVSCAEALNLAKLADLTRVRYVNHTFATLLADSKYDTVVKIQKADHEKLYNELKKMNKGNAYYKGHIGLKDMEFLVELSGRVSADVEY
jgi:methionine aminopeptidase